MNAFRIFFSITSWSYGGQGRWLAAGGGELGQHQAKRVCACARACAVRHVCGGGEGHQVPEREQQWRLEADLEVQRHLRPAGAC
jgi:hypothetical protein